MGATILPSEESVAGGRPVILRKTKSATQSLVAATATNVVMETTTENYGFTLASTSLFKPTVSGLYRVTAAVAFDSSTTGTRRLVVLFNNTGAANMAGPGVSGPALATAAQATNILLSGLYVLDKANDYALRARHDHTAAINVGVDTYLQVELVTPMFI